MAQSMVHRGPDDEGYYVKGPVGLGHRRLSIIDVKTGHQPMFNEDESICIVFNGEIYNHEALRKILESKGHTYRTHSDTESIVHAYEEFGRDFETQLTGMFAFAVWDSRHRRLILTRDRLGIKPLYYTVHAGQFIFASEIKAILTIEGVERRVDADALSAYLNLRYVPGPKTMFKNIFKLEPGHTLTVHNGQVQIRRYWELDFTEQRKDERSAARELEALLFDVCRDHLMSEVPYGVFLSGGLDSSGVTAVMTKLLHERVTTFTVGYEHVSGVNEFDYARVMSKHADSSHHELRLATKDFEDWMPQLVWHLDEPVGDSACVPLYFLARHARGTVTVLHSGEGADEILAGYSIYNKMQALSRLRTVFPPARTLGPLLAEWVGPGKVGLYLRLLGLPLSQRYHGVSGHFMTNVRQGLVTAPWMSSAYLSDTFGRHYKQAQDVDPLNQMLFVDTKTWLPDDLLIKADKMTMAASVELRVPYLDHRLVEFAASLPVTLKIRRGQTKYLLKKVMERFLPHEIIYRPKKGFPVPLEQWFRHGFYRTACEVLLSPGSSTRTFLDPGVVRNMLDRHQAGAGDWSNELWGLLVLEYWFKAFRVEPC